MEREQYAKVIEIPKLLKDIPKELMDSIKDDVIRCINDNFTNVENIEFVIKEWIVDEEDKQYPYGDINLEEIDEEYILMTTIGVKFYAIPKNIG